MLSRGNKCTLHVAHSCVGVLVWVTRLIRMVVEYTRYSVKTKSKLTNLMNLIRIEGYNGK